MPSHTPWPKLATLGELLNAAVEHFDAAELYYGHGTDNAWDEAVYLALWYLKLPWDVDEGVLNNALTDEQVSGLIAIFQRRINERIPAAYITGKAYFAGLPFTVNSDVLVPRSPIAELIAQYFAPWLLDEPQRILDLCTGSGCIGICCALAFPDAEVDLSDISRAALGVAEHNMYAHGVQDRVRVVEGDLFSGVEGEVYDLIVANPPYVDASDLASMPAEYHAEPELGLASGFDGLDFTRRLLTEAPNHLSENGLLVVEVGNSWEALENAYPHIPFTWVEFENGGHGVFVLSAAELRGRV
ncbi:50S ribosomal protein L3 N(5)-glutamine methyltransferase [Aurantivibrio plasticivorans]